MSAYHKLESPEQEGHRAFCLLAFPLPLSLFALFWLQLLNPSRATELAFPNLHCGLRTSGFPGSFQSSAARLGLLRYPALWTDEYWLSGPCPRTPVSEGH